MWRLLAALALCALVRTQRAPAVEYKNAQSPCYDAQGRSQRCQPVFMNAAFGRRVHATNTCGQDRSTNFCGITDKVCDVCAAGDPYRKHPPTFLTDYNNFENETWWQSDTMMEDIQYPNQVNLTLELGKAFDITYVQLKFKSPRPESFAIYKKSAAGEEWEPYQYYSSSCRDTYGLPDLVYLPEGNEDRAVCTSEFSDISPLTDGSVAFATLEGRPGALQFDYNRQLQQWVTATAIRITLNRLNTFGDEVFRDPRVLQSYYYAISDLAIGGTCKCNGHASNCVPSSSESGEERLVCQCQHNTAGADCERCLPFYNDVPWQRATPDDPSECKACNCNGYSNRCFFDKELFDQTGHGGHCTDCVANRDGVNCERCQENHYEREDGYCIPCACSPEGSRSLQCNINGKCSCKPGVGGDKCDRCENNFYDFSQQGCRECNCYPPGSLDNEPSCETTSGVCRCKENVEGQMCDRCKPGFFSISEENQFGCTPCFCYGHSSICDAATGYSEVVSQTEFVRSDEGWMASTYYGDPVAHAYKPLVQQIAVSAPGREAVYFSAPDRFLGDQRSSYNQDMLFTLRIGEYGPEASVRDVVLQGAGMEISQPIFGQENALPDQKSQEYTFRLHEDSQFGWSPRLRARDFISLLSNITAIKIRGTYTSEGIGFLEDFSMVSARRGVRGREATWVETCTCPPGYVGQFCESCEPGFRHEPANGGAFARCVACDCNGHADICDAESGKCICRDNTAGDNCELCARGFYGNALGGEPDDCKPCPCPGQGACIELYEDTVACLECPTGYTGHKCDICIDGWFGEPDNEMPCRECDCNGNVDPNAVGNCNRTSGECLKCIHDTAGFSCDRCLPGYFGDPLALPKGDCRTCGCNPVGTAQLEDEPEGPYLCDQLSGQCQCKAFVAGEKCERCVNGYWNILSGQGCEECDCDPVGSFNTSCDISSGQCFCREGVVGRKCDQCAVNMFGFSREGCLPCTCDPIGSLELQCAPDGQCPCRENVEGIHCDRCKENKYDRQAGCRGRSLGASTHCMRSRRSNHATVGHPGAETGLSVLQVDAEASPVRLESTVAGYWLRAAARTAAVSRPLQTAPLHAAPHSGPLKPSVRPDGNVEHFIGTGRMRRLGGRETSHGIKRASERFGSLMDRQESDRINTGSLNDILEPVSKPRAKSVSKVASTADDNYAL
ncbi:laminin subunit gamma-1-like [Pollicipes pollicipes]|uniref:laminin subunit gamma-1-like n=1 Tax=Pollicipes pollicipes TaxID=41117 RepID=UPI001884CB90|nr:laminin subunit gamma-1-like [Pollicipes pollicipes]